MPNAGLSPYACDCGWLEHAANDPTVPIAFDSEVNEYHLIAGTPGGVEAHYLIQYCPSCGGSAPPSHRDNLFKVVTPDERMRLEQLWSNLHTRDDVVRAWGPPDEHIPQGYGEMQPERDGKPAHMVNFDVMRYKTLSETAVVEVILCAADRVMFTYVSKPRAP